MIVFNFTGLRRTYWLPKFEHKHDDELRYFSVRFLQLELIYYSKAMGTEFINRFNRSVN